MTSGHPDPEVIRKRLAALREALSNLRRHAMHNAQDKVLSPEFASRLRPMAGFRNVLVHGYLQVDLNVLERVLRDKLQDLDEIAFQVEAYLAG